MGIKSGIVGGVIGALVAGSVGAAVAVPALRAATSSDQIVACASKTTGSMRLAKRPSDCKATETVVDWNAQGPAGPKGARGVAGVAGATGPAGAQGDRGPSDIWVARQDYTLVLASQEEHTPIVAIPQLGAGTYLVDFVANITLPNPGLLYAECVLKVAGTVIRDSNVSDGSSQVIALHAVVDLATASDVSVACKAGDARIYVYMPELTALAVETVHTTGP